MQAVTSDTMIDQFIEIAKGRAEVAFCIHYNGGDNETLTYGQLATSARCVAARLRTLEVGTGQVILLFVKHQVEIYASFVGCLMAGAIPSLMPYPNPKQDSTLFWKGHATLLTRIQPRLLVVSRTMVEDFKENLPEYAHLLCCVEDLAAAGPMADPRQASPDDIAFLQHSSGTTGLKKGVMLSHREVMAQIKAYQSVIGFTAEDIIASWLPLYHDMGLISCFVLTLMTGSTLVALDPFEWVSAPVALLEVIERHNATFCWLPNFAFNHLASTTRAGRSFDLSRVRAFINCSEPCKPESFEVFLRRFSSCGVTPEQLQVCYAMAENVFAVTQTKMHEEVRVIEVDRQCFETEGRIEPGSGMRLLSCGVFLPEVEIKIGDENGEALAADRIGEIMVRSPFLFSGYNGLPDITAKKLRAGWYHTGDLGFLLDGELFVTGRVDDLLIAYGRNYYAHEIEQIVSTVPGIVPGRSVAFSVASETAGTSHIVLVAETRDNTDDTMMMRSIREAVLAGCGLALHQLLLRPPGWLVKTTSGKISREMNKLKYLEFRQGRATS